MMNMEKAAGEGNGEGGQVCGQSWQPRSVRREAPAVGAVACEIVGSLNESILVDRLRVFLPDFLPSSLLALLACLPASSQCCLVGQP